MTINLNNRTFSRHETIPQICQVDQRLTAFFAHYRLKAVDNSFDKSREGETKAHSSGRTDFHARSGKSRRHYAGWMGQSTGLSDLLSAIKSTIPGRVIA